MKEFGGSFAGKTVLVTGHTGFKGSWLSLWLSELGARVVGFALPPETPSLFNGLGLSRLVDSRLGDVRDAALVEKTMREVRPEIVFHLAAQPLVRLSYDAPSETFAANVLGTAHVLDAVRGTDSVRVCQVVTTDKCYENREEAGYAYREEDRLGGRDPYSASKACAEIVAASYRDSFFSARAGRIVSLSTSRAGNVIGGGDRAIDRLLPDCARSLAEGRPIEVRNPSSTRPWQFVLEPLSGYLSLAVRQLSEPALFAEAWNFGPPHGGALGAGAVAELAVRAWGSGRSTSTPPDPGAPHEAGCLELDSSKSSARLGWKPAYGVEDAVAKTIAWYRAAAAPGFDAASFSREQISDYVEAARRAGAAWTAPLAAVKAR